VQAGVSAFSLRETFALKKGKDLHLGSVSSGSFPSSFNGVLVATWRILFKGVSLLSGNKEMPSAFVFVFLTCFFVYRKIVLIKAVSFS